MLDNIISSFFNKILFSHINEKIKLKLIRYNKRLQSRNDISLINYQTFTQKYIIYGEKGIGKEFKGNTNELIFEGEYLNGERNGKGKEYELNGELKFEGEYLNGK